MGNRSFLGPHVFLILLFAFSCCAGGLPYQNDGSHDDQGMQPDGGIQTGSDTQIPVLCNSGDERCVDNIVEVCNANGIWGKTARTCGNLMPIYPWTNGGPTATWSSQATQVSAFANVVNNETYVWYYDRLCTTFAGNELTQCQASNGAWQNDGNPQKLEGQWSSAFGSKIKPIGNVYPWTSGGPIASWFSPATKVTAFANVVNNEIYVWYYDRLCTTFAGNELTQCQASSGAWQNDGVPQKLGQQWTSAFGAKIKPVP